jgi:hypothetical protein
VRRPFYRRRRAGDGGGRGPLANGRARAGVIAWGRDDVGPLASAGREPEGACVFSRRGREIEATAARLASARVRGKGVQGVHDEC